MAMKESGELHEGWFKNNEMTGRGRIIWKNGAMFEGEFLNNMRNGIGKNVY